jgi:hypothetical protein
MERKQAKKRQGKAMMRTKRSHLRKLVSWGHKDFCWG